MGLPHGKWQRPLARNHLVTRRPLSPVPILYQPATLFYANPKDAIPCPPPPWGNRPPFSLFLYFLLSTERDSPFQFRPPIGVTLCPLILCQPAFLWRIREESWNRFDSWVRGNADCLPRAPPSAIKFTPELDRSYTTRTCVVGCLQRSLGKRVYLSLLPAEE